jgi:tRNA1(Val) A37 N6-methylase TrmN6
VMPIHPRAGRNATRILVFARRGGRSPLVLLPPLVLHADRGGFTPEAARLHDPEVADGGAVQGSGTKAAR